MSLNEQIMPAIRDAMRAKDKVALETLRAVKSELLKAETAVGASNTMSQIDEIKLLQKMQKQRKDAAAIYADQGREDLASDELAQAEVLKQFLPKQLSSDELKQALSAMIAKLNATGPSDMGKVIGYASNELVGKAEGRAIADTVKLLLSK